MVFSVIVISPNGLALYLLELKFCGVFLQLVCTLQCRHECQSPLVPFWNIYGFHNVDKRSLVVALQSI